MLDCEDDSQGSVQLGGWHQEESGAMIALSQVPRHLHNDAIVVRDIFMAYFNNEGRSSLARPDGPT